MSRYSRSVIPGRAGGDEDTGDLDRVIFGSKKKAGPAPANDAQDEPDFLPPVEDEEAGHLVERASADRRRGDRRGKSDDRRATAAPRRKSEYKPLKEEGYRSEDSKRGPILLVGALLIVGVFSFVVWNAYREGVKTEGDTTAAPPQLASAGAFKTPPRAVADVPVVKEAASAEVLEQLEGSPALAKASPEVRPEPAPAKAAPPPVKTAAAPPPPAPTPSKVTAPPPAALKTPAPAPTQVAAAKPAPAAPVATAQPVKAATPPPAAAPAAAGGNWVAQIAAASSEAGAISEWDKRAKASPELFSTAQRFVVQADVNGKTVYRLRAGPFASKADADAFCTAFKAKGGNCFPAAK